MCQHAARGKRNCCAVPDWTDCLQTSVPVVKAMMMMMIMQTRDLNIHSPGEPSKSKDGHFPSALAPNRSPCLECNLPAICRPPWLCLIFKQTPVRSPSLISHSSWKLAKSLNFFAAKREWKRGKCGFLFQPPVQVLNIDFLWKAQRTSSTFHSNFNE